MAEFLPPLVGRVVADVSGYSSELKKAGTDAEEAEHRGGGAFGKLQAVGQAAFMGLATAAVGLGGEAIHLADQFEASHARLVSALQATGVSFDSLKGRVGQVDASMTKYGYNNTEVEGALARLTQMTGNGAKALDNMGLVANIAAARHMDLESAATLVGKVMSGNVSILNRMGISLPLVSANALQLKKAHDAVALAEANLNTVQAKVTDGQLKGQAAATALKAAHDRLSLTQQKLADMSSTAGAAIAALGQKFGGQAQAQADTFGGKMKALETTGENLGIAIGLKLIPIIESLAQAVMSAVTWLEKHQAVAISLAAVIGGALLVAIGAWVAGMAAAAAETVAATWPIIAIAAAIAALVAGIVWAYQNVGWFRDILNTLASFITQTVWPAIQAFGADVATVFAAIWGVVQQAWAIIQPILDTLFHFIKDYLEAEFHGLQAVVQVVWPIISSAIQIAWDIIKPIWDAIYNFIKAFLEGEMQNLQTIWQAAWPVIQTAVQVAWGIIKPIWDTIVGVLRDVIPPVLGALGGLFQKAFNAALTAVQAVWGFLKPIFDNIQAGLSAIEGPLNSVIGLAGKAGGLLGGLASGHLPGLYKGGDVRPGSVQVVGERGPELFVPSSAGTVIPNGQAFGSGGGGGGTTVSVVVHVAGSVTAERQLVNTVGQGIVDSLRRQGVKLTPS